MPRVFCNGSFYSSKYSAAVVFVALNMCSFVAFEAEYFATVAFEALQLFKL